MVLPGAPVTGLTLFISSISSAILSEHYARHRSHSFVMAAALPTTSSTHLFTFLRRALLQSIPIGPMGVSLNDTVLTFFLLFQMRQIERRWGSGLFMAYLWSSAVIGVVAMQGLVVEGVNRQLTVDALRIFSAAASLTPLTALAVRYLREVPSLSPVLMQTSSSAWSINTKMLCILVPLTKLILFPNTQLQSASFQRSAVTADVGFWVRLCFALLGVLFAVLSARPASWVSCWLRLVMRYITGPLLSCLRPIVEPVFGPPFFAEHVKPRRPLDDASLHRGGPLHQSGAPTAALAGSSGSSPTAAAAISLSSQRLRRGDGGGQAVVGDNGRYVVDSLVGRESGYFNGDMGLAPPLPLQRRQQQRRHVSEGELRRHRTAITAIEALELGASSGEIIAALEATGGDIDAAVHLLLS